MDRMGASGIPPKNMDAGIAGFEKKFFFTIFSLLEKSGGFKDDAGMQTAS